MPNTETGSATYSGTRFTPYMRTALDGIRNRLRNFYCQEDFYAKIQEVITAEKSSYASRLKELEDMCELINSYVDDLYIQEYMVDANRLLDPKTSSLEMAKIPTRNVLKFQMLTEIYAIYNKFLTPAQFMDRIVRRLLKGEFENDSTRMAILKKFVKGTDFHTKIVTEWVQDHLTDGEKNDYDGLDENKKREFIISHLDEEIFQAPRVDFSEWGNFYIRKVEEATVHEPFSLSANMSRDFSNLLSNLDVSCSADADIREMLTALFDVSDEKIKVFDKYIEDALIVVETEFCAYLQQFTYIVDGIANGQKDEHVYLTDKMDFIKEKCNVWELLHNPQNINGRFDADYGDWIKFIIQQMDKYDINDKSLEAIDSWSQTKKNLLDTIKESLNLKFVSDATILGILKAIMANWKSYKRRPWARFAELEPILSDIEADVCTCLSNLLGKYREEKAEFIRTHLVVKNHINIAEAYGRNGLPVKNWAWFLLQKIKTEKPPRPFCISKTSTDNLKSLLVNAGCDIINSSDGLVVLKEAIGWLANGNTFQDNDAAYEIIKTFNAEFSNYLKKFSNNRETRNKKYDRAYKDFRRNNGNDLTLIELADDLASGKFRPNGKTKELLYIFALAFDMSVYFGFDEEIYDGSRDIEKNLFGDYYCDNLLRYICDEHFDSKIFEPEPSGYGINYKNFEEVIWLYFLYRQDLVAPGNKNGWPRSLTPEEKRLPEEKQPRSITIAQKIDYAQKLIAECSKIARNSTSQKTTTHPDTKTAIFRDSYFLEDMRFLEPSDLCHYLAENFFINDPSKKTSANIMYASKQNTATIYYSEMSQNVIGDQEAEDENHYEIMKNLYPDISDKDIGTGFDYGIDGLSNLLHDIQKYITEFDRYISLREELIHDDNPLLKPKDADIKQIEAERISLYKNAKGAVDDQAFVQLLHEMDRRLHIFSSGNLNKELKNIKLTRTKLISLYYCHFSNIFGNYINSKKSFSDIYEMFCNGYGNEFQGINPYLEMCNYQKINPQNIFDMFLIISLYIELAFYQ